MNVTNIKHYAAVGALIAGLGMAPLAVRAADNADISASINIVGALDADKQADMDFGTWYFVAGSTPTTWVKDTAGTVSETAGTAATAEGVGTANTTPAQIDISITDGTAAQNGSVITMTVATPSAFDNDTDAALSDITYKIGAGSEVAYTVPVAVTIADATAPVSVYFGGTITASDTLSSGTNTATFNVSFAY